MLATDLVNPAELTGFVRGLVYPDLDLLAQFLPNRERPSIDYAFNRTDRVRRTAAQYRPFDVESPIGDRPGLARVRGRIPPISKKMVLMEEEQLLAEALRRQTTVTPEMEDAIYNDARNLTRDILDRIEYARGQVLSTGKVTLTSDLGFEVSEIDYGIPGGNFVTTPGAAWSDLTNSVPITDIRGWIYNTYMPANANKKPVVGLTDIATLLNLQQNAQVKGFIPAANFAGQVMPILTDVQVQAVFAAQGLPPIIAIDELVNIVGLGQTRVLPAGRVIFLPAPSDIFGETTFGPTAEALNLAQSNFLPAASAPGLTALNMKTFDPMHIWTKVAGLAVPVLKDPNAVMVADVSI